MVNSVIGLVGELTLPESAFSAGFTWFSLFSFSTTDLIVNSNRSTAKQATEEKSSMKMRNYRKIDL